ncbi:MAG: pantetheine-phosphate adenylyltransferase [Lachnospiraceae bacterium]|jgi:pantetheine-phosphate adenylyltransferase|nr:pantetheine-phosphate adenylyltransferase [Lachnospiraceae bacterium]
MAVAVYPGSFDPITRGHYDIIERTAKIMDHLVVAVLRNSSKTPLFTVEERMAMVEELVGGFPNVVVETFDGLLIDFVRSKEASVIVRGLRAVTDFEYELQMAQTNRVMAPEIDTLFLTTNLKYSYLSSNIVKEIALYDGDVSPFVHPQVAERVKAKLLQK